MHDKMSKKFLYEKNQKKFSVHKKFSKNYLGTKNSEKSVPLLLSLKMFVKKNQLTCATATN